MGRGMQLAAAGLALTLILPGALPRAEAAVEDQLIRVGLAYGSGALPAANLENSVGSGYRLGYYEEDGTFVELASTGETKITMLRADTLYLSGGAYSKTAAAGATAVGGWYVLLGSYSSYSAAQSAAAGVSGAYAAWQDGSWQVRWGTYESQSAAAAAQTAQGLSGTVGQAGSSAVTVVRTGTAQVLFQYDGEESFGVMPDVTGQSDPVTWFKGYKYYGGFRYERIGGGDLTVVNMVYLEDYVRCVITWEMGASWEQEALKAQACCARTYVLRSLDKHSTYHFDVCSETDCQAYHGTGNLTANSIQAAAGCEGVCVWYQGSLAETVYSSSNGGASEDSENVWSNAVPYLRGKSDPYEALIADSIPNYRWSVTFTADELEAKLQAKGYQCTDLASVQATQTSATGGVLALTFTDAGGKSWTFYKQDARTFLGLRSQRYTVTSGGGTGGGGTSQLYAAGGGSLDLAASYAIGGDGTVNPVGGSAYVLTGDGVEAVGGSAATGADTYTFTGTGYGHGVGMSQYGAQAMAKEGYTYDEILQFYFTGVDVY